MPAIIHADSFLNNSVVTVRLFHSVQFYCKNHSQQFNSIPSKDIQTEVQCY